jgi:Na+-driven multidrug efflux pump
MRKILAIISTIITLLAIKEMFYIFTTSDHEIIQKKAQYSIVSLSITLPLILLTLWLWLGKRK